MTGSGRNGGLVSLLLGGAGGAAGRFARTGSAQLYNQVASMAVQLLLVPLLLHFWGTERYGVWLLLSAAPTYLTLSDFGFTFIAKNEMVMQVASARRDDARCTFQSVFVLLTIAGPLLMSGFMLVVWLADVGRWLSLGSFPLRDVRIVLSLLLLNVIFYQFSLLAGAGIRCENRAASEACWSASARIGEGLAIAIVAMCGGSLIAVAIATVANRAAFNVASYVWMRRNTPWLALGFAAASRAEIRRLLRPALGYMLMPISQAIVTQGPLLILGSLSGPATVVIFSTSRTLSRIGTAFTNMLNSTVVAEYSARAGLADRYGFTRILKFHLLISAAAILGYCAFILMLNAPLMRIFTHGKVAVYEPFFAILVGSVAAEMMWNALFSPISAVNRHMRVANYYFLFSALGLALSWYLCRQFGLWGVAAGLLAIHALMIVACERSIRRSMPERAVADPFPASKAALLDPVVADGEETHVI